MKLSFSTKGWHDSTFEEFCAIAESLKFKGIELHNINNKLFTDRDGAFHDYSAASTLRKLYDKKLTIPCIDIVSDISLASEKENAKDELARCFEIAQFLHIPYIRLKSRTDDTAGIESAKDFIGEVLPEAEERGITLLLETAGLFRNTSVLRETLESFASDSLGALWNLSEAFAEERPELRSE